MPIVEHRNCSVFDTEAEVVAHQVNCLGVMGSGVAKQVKELFPEVYTSYRNHCIIEDKSVLLGCCLMVKTTKTSPQYIANIFGQFGYGSDGRRRTDYQAVETSLRYLRSHMKMRDLHTVAIPYKMSCDRGGGDWNIVKELINQNLNDIDVIICEWKP